MYDLENKTALVTGAGGKLGAGRRIATRLAQEGADVIVNDISSRPYTNNSWGGLPALVKEIQAIGRKSMSIIADVSDEQSVISMIDQAIDKMGKIDILVNNAAVSAGKDRVPVVELLSENWDSVQKVNIRGTFLCCREVARHMTNRTGGGRIINMSSVYGKRSAPRYAAYSASKFAILGLTQALAAELGPVDVTVNALCPNLIATERLEPLSSSIRPHLRGKEAQKIMVDQAVSQSPLGRIASVTDIANAVAFLSSDQASYLTGLSLTIAGGSLMI